jgi:hypothetical protein
MNTNTVEYENINTQPDFGINNEEDPIVVNSHQVDVNLPNYNTSSDSLMPFGNPQKLEGAKEEAKVQPVISFLQSTTTEEPLTSIPDSNNTMSSYWS